MSNNVIQRRNQSLVVPSHDFLRVQKLRLLDVAQDTPFCQSRIVPVLSGVMLISKPFYIIDTRKSSYPAYNCKFGLVGVRVSYSQHCGPPPSHDRRGLFAESHDAPKPEHIPSPIPHWWHRCLCDLMSSCSGSGLGYSYSLQQLSSDSCPSNADPLGP